MAFMDKIVAIRARVMELFYNSLMRKSARLRIVILALMLVVSHAALMSHVTAHFHPDLEQCELCVSQAQLLTAVPSSDQPFDVLSRSVDSQFGPPRCVIRFMRLIGFQQRAPPLTST